MKTLTKIKTKIQNFLNGRVTPEKLKFKDINIENDTIPLRVPFIPSEDTVYRIVAFPYLPVRDRNFKINFLINSAGEKKIIDFDFSRQEYRSKGNNFKKPPEKKEGP